MEDIMNRLLLGKLTALLLMLLVLPGWKTPDLPVVIQMENWGGNHPATNMATFPSDFDVVEWDTSTGDSAPAIVATRAAPLTLIIRLHNPNGVPTIDADFAIWNVRYIDDTGTYNLSVEGNSSYSEPVSIGANGTWTVATLDITGLPNHVSKGQISYDFSVDGSGPTGGGGRNWPTYLVDSTPLGVQDSPWLEVLDDGCAWAEGLAGADNCRAACTTAMFDQEPFYFTEGTPQYFVTTGSTRHYELTEFLDDRLDPGQEIGESKDISGYLHIVFCALGDPSYLEEQKKSGGGDFRTNSICTMGEGRSNPANYASITIDYHQVVMLDGGSTDYVYDATAAQLYTLVGTQYRNTPNKWEVNGYWQTSSGIDPPLFYGLVAGIPGTRDNWVTRSGTNADLSYVE
jgi:hypothetical protein